MLKGERVVALTATEARLSGRLMFYRKADHAVSLIPLRQPCIKVWP
jgi:hypothetical protein